MTKPKQEESKGKPETKDAPPAKQATVDRFVFERSPACPRCGTQETHHRSTQGEIQYRECDTAICRFRFKIVGKPA